MKVTGPGSGPGALPEDIAGPEKASQAGEKGSGAPPAGVVATHDIAAELRAGTLAPGAAMEKLIDRIVTQQLGPGAPVAMRESLRAALQETVDTDPMLATKLRSLGRLQDG